MSHTIGELVVIALKAENIPNRIARGSQDPFCVFKLGSLAKKTKIDKRGGQNPIWDDQINLAVPGGVTRLFFQIFHGQTSSENLISEGHVDLHEVLRKGEHDGFFPLIYNGNKAGRIYLELTFYANQVPAQPPPIRYVSQQYPSHQRPPPNIRPMPPPNGRPMMPPPNGRPMPPPSNVRPMPPPSNVRPMPPPSNVRPMPPPSSSNMRPNYAHSPHPHSHPPVQQSISTPPHMDHNQRYSNVPPPPQRQPSYHQPPPPSSNSVHSRHSSMPGPQPVLAASYHPPPMSTPRPANGYPAPRPMPPQQNHSYNNSIPHSSQRPLPLAPQQPYYSNQPPPLRQRPPF